MSQSLKQGISLQSIQHKFKNDKAALISAINGKGCTLSANHPYWQLKEEEFDKMRIMYMMGMEPSERQRVEIINNPNKMYTTRDFYPLPLRTHIKHRLRCTIHQCCHEYFVSKLTFDENNGWWCWHWIPANKVGAIKLRGTKYAVNGQRKRVRVYLNCIKEVIMVPHDMWIENIPVSDMIKRLNRLQLIQNGTYSIPIDDYKDELVSASSTTSTNEYTQLFGKNIINSPSQENGAEFIVWSFNVSEPYDHKMGFYNIDTKQIYEYNLCEHKTGKNNDLIAPTTEVNLILDIYPLKYSGFIQFGHIDEEEMKSLSVSPKLIPIKTEMESGCFKICLSTKHHLACFNMTRSIRIGVKHNNIIPPTTNTTNKRRKNRKRPRSAMDNTEKTDDNLDEKKVDDFVDVTVKKRKLNNGAAAIKNIKSSKYESNTSKLSKKKIVKKAPKKKKQKGNIIEMERNKIKKKMLEFNKYEKVDGYNKFNEKWIYCEEIARGRYGSASKAYSIDCDELICIKAMEPENNVEKTRKMFDREISILKDCQCPFVLIFYDSYIGIDNKYYLMTELLEISLDHFFKKASKRDINDSLPIITNSCCKGLAYIHTKGYKHGDMKEQNIMLQNRILKIIDFGLARLITAKLNGAGTLQYASPEILKSKMDSTEGTFIGTESIDTYALGVILLNGYYQYPVQPKQELSLMIDNQKKHIDRVMQMGREVPFQFKSILAMMLQSRPDARLSAAGIIQNDYLINTPKLMPAYAKSNPYKNNKLIPITNGNNPYLKRIQ